MIRMLIVSRLVLKFIKYCIQFGVAPWKYFQLNAKYFNKEKGIFSKLEMDRIIPEQWRLKQVKLINEIIPDTFPVFLKPEWGQNANGIHRADSIGEYQEIRQQLKQKKDLNYIIQEAAWGGFEYEIFYIRNNLQKEQFASFSVTEVCNVTEEYFPINSVQNNNTCYLDRSADYTSDEKQQLWKMIHHIGDFKIARIAVSADSKQELLRGIFHIIEINIFIPMPLNLLDHHVPWKVKNYFIDSSMMALAKNVGSLPKSLVSKPIFFKKLMMHYRVKT